MKCFYFMLLGILLAGGVFSETRVWQTLDGRSFIGEFERQDSKKLYFRDENRDIQIVSATNLIPSHLRYIRTQIPPEIALSFRAKKSVPKGVYADKDVTIIDGTARITNASRYPFEGELRGELYFVGKEVATDIYMMLAKEQFVIRFPDTKKQVFEYKMSAKARVYLEFNFFEMRGRDYDGYLLVVLGPSGEILETKTDLKWLKDDNIDRFRTLEVFNFFREDCKKRSVPRPKYYNSRGFM